MNRCRTHGPTKVNKGHNFVYAWVGNSVTQCPDQCAWPFVQPVSGYSSLEAVTACTGIFGLGAYPGYPGSLLVDKKTKVSYNAQGMKGRKYLLPTMWDPNTSTCKTLV
ncbi:putative protein EXORDIUM [Helianthus anomalus]